jgi:hypothetical protein
MNPSPLTRDLLIALAFIGGAALLVTLTPTESLRDVTTRALGFSSGLLVAYYANQIPRTRLVCVNNPREEQSRRRFAGWALVVGGLSHALIWLLAPLPGAAALSMVILASSVASVFVRCRITRHARPGAGLPAN